MDIKDFLKYTGKTSLDDQIDFMKNMNKMFRNPLFDSIINSLVELKGIKQKQVEEMIKKDI
jgi:hypothetical protein